VRVFFFLFIATFLYSCSGQNKKAPVEKETIKAEVQTAKKLLIQKVGELGFRRTYSGSDPDNKWDNPWGYNRDTLLVKSFQEIGLVTRHNRLLLEKFDSCKLYDYDHPEASFILTDLQQKNLKVQFCYKGGYANFDLSVADGQQSSEIEIDGSYFEGLKYLLLDIVDGGYKEIVVLNNYYIMNGDNSDLLIYEIKYN